ncbi:MAG: hypothetical protein AB8B36_06710 [Prochlorococcus sp.]
MTQALQHLLLISRAGADVSPQKRGRICCESRNFGPLEQRQQISSVRADFKES